MKSKSKRFKSADTFGRALGFSDVEMELIRQKKLLVQKVREARIKLGLSQATLAQMISSKQPAIARMESGQISQISMDFLLKIALALGQSVTIRPLKKAA